MPDVAAVSLSLDQLNLCPVLGSETELRLDLGDSSPNQSPYKTPPPPKHFIWSMSNVSFHFIRTYSTKLMIYAWLKLIAVRGKYKHHTKRMLWKSSSCWNIKWTTIFIFFSKVKCCSMLSGIWYILYKFRDYCVYILSATSSTILPCSNVITHFISKTWAT